MNAAVVARRIEFECPWLAVEANVVRRFDGSAPATYYSVRTRDYMAVLALTDTGHDPAPPSVPPRSRCDRSGFRPGSSRRRKAQGGGETRVPRGDRLPRKCPGAAGRARSRRGPHADDAVRVLRPGRACRDRLTVTRGRRPRGPIRVQR
jgi:hypothetical protein